LQELIKRRASAIEGVNIIGSAQFGDCPIHRTLQPSTPGLVSNFFKRGFAFTGRSSAA
jgi:hypothetical protein